MDTRSKAIARRLAVIVALVAGCTATVETAPGAGTPTISGTISGAVADGVLIALSGPAYATTTTAGGGHYALPSLADGRYLVTPSLAGYTFTPASLTVDVAGASVGDQDFIASAILPPTYVISGTVGGYAADGVLLTLSGPASVTTTTAAGGGHYAFPGLADGRYLVTPSLAGYTFTPTSLTVDVSGASVGDQDFFASAVPPRRSAISGTISGAADVAVLLDGAGVSSTTRTDASGMYSFSGLPNGAYTLAPYLPGYSFSPAQRTATVNGADVGGADFAATRTAIGLVLSGTIVGAPSVICTIPQICVAGVRLRVSGSIGTGIGSILVRPDDAGRFLIDGLMEGNTVTLAPQLSGYTFTPATRSVTMGTTDVLEQDFVGAPNP